MLVKLAIPYENLAGKHEGGGNGLVNYRSRGRQFARNYVIPANPQSETQDIMRIWFSQVSTAWKLVTDNEAAAWATLAQAMPASDIFGQPYQWFPNNAYLAVNSLRLIAGDSITDTAPTYALAVAPTISTATVGSNTLTINLTGTVSGQRYLLRVTPPLSSPRYSARNNEFRLITDAFDESVATASGTTLSVGLSIDRFTVASGDRVGIIAQAMTATYIPGQAGFARNIALGTTP